MQPETVREMLLPSMVSGLTFSEMPPIDEFSGFSYGLGWANYHYHGYFVIEKAGALDGIRTIVCFVPALNAGVAIAANPNHTALPEAICGYVLEQLLELADVDVQAKLRAAGAILEELFAAVPVPPTNPAPPSVPLAAITGTYENALYDDVRIVEDGDGLLLEAGTARRPANLTHFNFDTFLLGWRKVTSVPELTTFTIRPDGIALSVQHDTFDRMDRVGDE